jgi:lysophospholipase L1-like esterase
MASDSKPRYRGYLVNALTFVLTLALIAGAVELYVRLVEDDGMQFDLEMWKYAKSVKTVSSDPLLGHEHRPNADAFLMGTRVTTNSAGFRDEEISIVKRPGSTRIMMLGDSVLFGWGAKQNETVAARLKQAWRQAGRDVDVINTGVGNYNTIMEVEFFLTRGYRFKPDIVVLNYFINDAESIPRYDYSWIERVSAAWVFYGSRLDVVQRELRLGQRTDWRAYYRGLYDSARNPGGWEGVESSIRKLAAYCRDNGIKLLFVNYPELRVLQPYPFPEVQQRLAALAADLRLPYLDLWDSLRGENPASLWVTPPDPHPNGYAHGLFAKAIGEWVARERLLP